MNALPSHEVSDELIQLLRKARSVTVLTGAGISAESGIPTFRESQTGLWAQYNPQQLATPEAFQENPRLVLDWYRWRRGLVKQARPNPGHFALAQMEKHVPDFTLITQNVDGLHYQAGSRNVIELHGSILKMRCMRCDFTLDDWPEDNDPHCPNCARLLRPAVVWFGESLPSDALERAVQASRGSEVFFSVGTSGVVEPAASLPYEALRSGSLVVEINPIPTPLNVYTQFYYSQPAGVMLPELVSAVWGSV